MKETSSSLSMYFVLCGLFQSGSALVALAGGAAGPTAIMAVLALIAGMCAVWLGMSMDQLLREQPGVLYGFVWLGLCLVSLLFNASSGDPSGIYALITLIISAYLHININRLANAQYEFWLIDIEEQLYVDPDCEIRVPQSDSALAQRAVKTGALAWKIPPRTQQTGVVVAP